MRPSKQIFALGCLVAAVAAGCSGSDDDDAVESSVDTPATASEPPTSTSATTVAPGATPTTATGPTDPTVPAGAAPVCTELRRVRTISDEISLTMAPVLMTVLDPEAELDLASLPAIADELDARLPDVLDAYADASAVAEDDAMAADIDAVAGATEAVTPLLVQVFRSADSVEDLTEIEQVLSSPENQSAAVSAGEASLRLDEFTVPECGFKFSN
jgi:hypothetical protein